QGLKKLFYDDLDRIILTIDAKGNKFFTKYDKMGRVAMSGLYFGNAIPLTNSSNFFEIRTNSSTGYTNTCFPTGNIAVKKINFYDDYDFNSNQAIDQDEKLHPYTLGNVNHNYTNKHVNGLLTRHVTHTIEPDGSNSTELSNTVFYDGYHRAIQEVSKNHTGEEDQIEREFNHAGWLLKERTKHRVNFAQTSSSVLLKEYTHDINGRVKNTAITINGVRRVISNKEYDENDRLQTKNLGWSKHNQKFLQNISYAYNIRGKLKQINSIDDCDSYYQGIGQVGPQKQRTSKSKSKSFNIPKNNSKENLFSMKFNYSTVDKDLNNNPNFEDQLSSLEWRDGCESQKAAYTINYNARNQLDKASYHEAPLAGAYQNTNTYTVEGISYDKNGNLKSLKRNGTTGIIDDMHYHINADNTLTSIEEFRDKNEGFKSILPNGHGYFDYDLNGNMTKDEHKGIKDIVYNELNLPMNIIFKNQNEIRFTYDFNGNKLKKETKVAGGNWISKDYFGAFEYQDGVLEAIYHEDGRIVPFANNYQFEYSIKDHLGNSRVSFSDLDGNGKIDENHGEVLQRNHYYPFGLAMEGSWNSVSGLENAYKFNGKELNSDFGLDWYDYEARWYDPAIGRWHVIDPKAEKFTSWSPYNYVMNNPFNLIDPDGMEPSDPGNDLMDFIRRVFREAPQRAADERIETLRRMASRNNFSGDFATTSFNGIGHNLGLHNGSYGAKVKADPNEILMYDQELTLSGVTFTAKKIRLFKKEKQYQTVVTDFGWDNRSFPGTGTNYKMTLNAISGDEVVRFQIDSRMSYESIKKHFEMDVERRFQSALNADPQLKAFYDIVMEQRSVSDLFAKTRLYKENTKESEEAYKNYHEANSRYKKNLAQYMKKN
ncbi:MAG: RHS repeat-associated core domain-containing protein, partial [Flavobacteriales bacterium]|nr:RHS repeat-associated core domain-containing protein [Flavobacteriales bacterium]